jgi:signal recognition particle GTPase
MAKCKDKIPAAKMTPIEQYLQKVAHFTGSEYGKLVRTQFEDIEGSSELAMLAAPTAEELEQLKRAVAIMTPSEKQNAANLTDDQIQRIAADARIDPANFAIFINGYSLYCKRK